MTYGLGLYLKDGIVITADTRTNAGVDHVATVRKLNLFQQPGQSIMALASAGNLATTQAVATILEQRTHQPGHATNLFEAPTMFDAATMVGNVLREVMTAHANHVQGYGDPSASMLFGGQIRGEGHCLFLIYSAGNFIQATSDTCFLQIGELKYGKPILDRAFRFSTTSMADAVKLSLLSFDATVRSNLSVAPPFDMICYRANALEPLEIRRFEKSDAYYSDVRRSYSQSLRETVSNLPVIDWPGVIPGGGQ